MAIVINHLRYLLLILSSAIVYISSAEQYDCAILENQDKALFLAFETHYIDSPSLYSHSSTPSQPSNTKVFCGHRTAKRVCSLHKNSYKSIKDDEVANERILNLIQKKSLNIQSAFIKTNLQLISLGKLLI